MRLPISVIKYLAAVFALFLIIFEILRGTLLIYYHHLATAVPPVILLQSFLVGLRFDLAVTGYIVSPVVLVGPLPYIGVASSALTRRICNVYLVILAAIAFAMELIDLEFLGQFNTRLNHLALEWIDSPALVFRMLWEWFAVIPVLIGWLLLVGIFAFALRFLTRRIFREIKPLPLKQFAIVYPLILALVFLAIRGRVAVKAPLTWGVAYFSTYNFANQLALNSCFTFVQDGIIENSQRKRDAALVKGMTPDEAYGVVRDLLELKGQAPLDGSPVARLEDGGERYDHNVVIILMESLTADFIGCCGGRNGLSPEFDRMSEDGLLFREFYSSGGHTFTGIFSTVTGLPSLPGRSLMKRGEGQQRFSGLATILKERGYHTRFYATHDTHFDNMQGFLVANDFDQVVGQSDYPASEVISSLGVPDHVMFDKALAELNEVEEPFLALLLTGSHHGPFIIPDDKPYPRVDPKDPEAKRYNAFSYADWSLGRFYDQVKQTDWGKNCLLAITGDSGVIIDKQVEMDLALFRVPLLLIDEGVISPAVSDRVGGQKDIVATVLGVLGGTWVNNTLGIDLRSDVGTPHALFIEGRATGFISPPYFLLRSGHDHPALYRFDNLSLPVIEDNLTNEMIRYSKALLSTTYYMVTSMSVGLPVTALQ